jgi:hypothetical protein
MNTPRFQHDCDRIGCCTFVGLTLNCDVYHTRSGGVIMRASSEGADYRSYPSLAIAQVTADRSAETFHAVQLVQQYLSS